MKEKWKDITGYHGAYQISDLGSVKSFKRKGTSEERILSLGSNGHGYLNASLSLKSKIRTAKVHRLVAIAFLDNPSNKKNVNHKNGIKTDNRKSNLEWVTSKENSIHSVKTGLTKQMGETHQRATLTNKEVLEIRNFYHKYHFNFDDVAYLFNINRSTCYHIVKRKSWKHI